MYEFPKYIELAEQAWDEAIKALPDSEFEGGFTFEEVAAFEKVFYRVVVESCLDAVPEDLKQANYSRIRKSIMNSMEVYQ